MLSTPVATGTNPDGTRSGAQASNWTSTSVPYDGGNANATTDNWTLEGTSNGAIPAHLYCFGVDMKTPLSIVKAPGRLAFVSHTPFTPSDLAFADQVCQSDAGGLPAGLNFRALLATSQASAASRFNLTGPTWVRLDGIPWLNVASDLESGRVLTALNLDPFGNYHGVADAPTWTGAMDASMRAAVNCTDWTNTAGNSITGLSNRVSTLYFGGPSIACLQPLVYLYCLQE
jgi:hypothetical protein